MTPSKRRIVEIDVLATTTGSASQPESEFFLKMIDALRFPHTAGLRQTSGQNEARGETRKWELRVLFPSFCHTVQYCAVLDPRSFGCFVFQVVYGVGDDVALSLSSTGTLKI